VNPRHRILTVDDQPENLLILEDLLGVQYDLQVAHSGSEALALLSAGPAVDLILLDVVMPAVDGFEICRRIKADPRQRHIPVIFLTSLDSVADEEYGLSLGAEDFIHKPFSPPVVLARVRNHLKLGQATRQLREQNEQLERLVAARTEEVQRQAAQLVRREQDLVAAQDATIMAFCALAETRDNETGNHILRTRYYVKALAEALKDHPQYRGTLNDEIILLLYKSAPLHDLGKVGIPDSVLLKPGPLSPEEWEIMKRHCEFGRDAIDLAARELGSSEDFLRCAREIAYSHHERWDGKGYPQGLAGAAIPLSARLMAIADVYDALISRRVYKPAFPPERAKAMILGERGTQFDPLIVDVFGEIAGTFDAIAEVYRDPPYPGVHRPASGMAAAVQ
jgi:putative two-component system response regulator